MENVGGLGGSPPPHQHHQQQTLQQQQHQQMRGNLQQLPQHHLQQRQHAYYQSNLQAAQLLGQPHDQVTLQRQLQQADDWFVGKLESLNQQIQCMSTSRGLADNGNFEGEVSRLQQSLGQLQESSCITPEHHDNRLQTLNMIEKAIQRLQSEQAGRSYGNESNNKGIHSLIAHGMELRGNVNTSQMQSDQGIIGNDSGMLEDDSSPLDILREAHLLPNHNGSNLGGISSHGPHYDPSLPAGHIPPPIEAVLRGTWPVKTASHSSPASLQASMRMSYHNGTGDSIIPGIMAQSDISNLRGSQNSNLLTNKVDMVYGLLSMFSSVDHEDMSKRLLDMSSSPEYCIALRDLGCIPLLIQLLHGGSENVCPTRETRIRANKALQNIVHSHPDDKHGRREARVLRLLEQIREYSDYLYERLVCTGAGGGPLLEDDMARHPCPAMAAIMKLSFDEEHRHAMCILGGLHAIAELIKRDLDGHGSTTNDQYCVTLRRYAGMALTNLTFGDGTNKALLCSFKPCLKALVAQLNSPSEDLRQVTASVLRNLSWRADGGSKTSLQEVGAVSTLIQVALTARKESTLKVILSAVWNLSAHCSSNKVDICAVDGALSFICNTLTYKSQSKMLAIVENGGGILRNISSHIAVREDLREVLREHSTLSVLLGQLRSPSLTVVNNACGTLWNLSARCSQDQRTLWELGAVPMLRSLINSKHKMISMGSSAALKNLLSARPEGMYFTDSRHSLGLPTLQGRKQKALEEELDPSLTETCDNIETSPRSSPTNLHTSEPNFNTSHQIDSGNGLFNGVSKPMFHSLGSHYNKGLSSESRESISSTLSDKSHDRMRHLLLGQQGSGSDINSARQMELSMRSRAPPSHGLPDVAQMSEEELDKHLEAQTMQDSTQEIFSARMRIRNEVNNLHAREFRRDPNLPHSEAHYNMHSKFVKNGHTVADIDIEGESLDRTMSYEQLVQPSVKLSEESDLPTSYEQLIQPSLKLTEESDLPEDESSDISFEDLDSADLVINIDVDPSESKQAPVSRLAKYKPNTRPSGLKAPEKTRPTHVWREEIQSERSQSPSPLSTLVIEDHSLPKPDLLPEQPDSESVKILGNRNQSRIPPSGRQQSQIRQIKPPGTSKLTGIPKVSGKPLGISSIQSPSSNQPNQSITSPSEHAQPFPSPRRLPQNKPIPIARVTPAVKVAGTRVSPRQSLNQEENDLSEQIPNRNTEIVPSSFTQDDNRRLSRGINRTGIPRSGSRTPTASRTRTPSPRPKTPTTNSRPRTPASNSSSRPMTPLSRPRTPQSPYHKGRTQLSQWRGGVQGECQDDSEGSPDYRSHHSSLNSLDGADYQSHNTARTRESSESLLSVESYGEEETLDDTQVQDGSTRGLPKSNSDFGIRRGRGRGRSRIPSPSSYSPPRMVPGVPIRRLTLVSDQQSRARSAEIQAASLESLVDPKVESSKLHIESEQSEKKEMAYRQVKEEEEENSEGCDTMSEGPFEEDIHDVEVEVDTGTSTPIVELSEDVSELTEETIATHRAQTEQELDEAETVSLSEGSTAPMESPVEERKISWNENREQEQDNKSPPSDISPPSDLSMSVSMSESGMLAREALKVAKAVNESKMMSSDEVSHMSMSAISDVMLDNIKPPLTMGSLASTCNSLTTSIEQPTQKHNNSNQSKRLECRHTRPLPEMVRRALGVDEFPDYNGFDGPSSLASSCHSNVDNIAPPSMMGDDENDEMENSMMSIASINSEVAKTSLTSLPTDNNHTENVGNPAHQLAEMFYQEAINLVSSTKTLTAGVGGDEASTYHEVTDITDHDETIGPATDTDFNADDIPPDVEDLPIDSSSPKFGSPYTSPHSSPRHGGTPKAKRRFNKDNTSILPKPDLKLNIEAAKCEVETSEEIDAVVSPFRSLTPRQKRQEEVERYKTFTISSADDTDETPTYTINKPVENVVAKEVSDDGNLSPSRLLFRKRRQEEPNRFQTRTIEVPPSILHLEGRASSEGEAEETMAEFEDSNELLELTDDQLDALQADANLVINQLNENRESMICGGDISPEKLSNENILDIESLSLISTEDLSEIQKMMFEVEEPKLSDEEMEDDTPLIFRPRIVKPGEEAPRPPKEEDLDAGGKSIRGRRKPLYSAPRRTNAPNVIKPTTGIPFSPVRGPQGVRSPAAIPSGPRANSTSPGKQTSPNFIRGAKNLFTAQRSSSSGEDSPVNRGTASPLYGSSKSSPGRQGPTPPPYPRQARSKSVANPLQQRDTFLRDNGNDQSGRSVQNIRPSLSYPQRSGLQKPKFTMGQTSPSTGIPSPGGPKSGLVSHASRGSDRGLPHPKSISLTRNARPPTAKDMVDWDKDSKGGKTVVKKDVTSRIANLWKKVEKAQTKPKERDTRVWLKGKGEGDAGGKLPRPLVRSSTYEKLPGVENSSLPSSPSTEVASSRQTRLGLKLSKLKGRETRSASTSIATTPVEPTAARGIIIPTYTKFSQALARPSTGSLRWPPQSVRK